MRTVNTPHMEATLQALVDVARQTDSGIRDIILIGSAVYAPDMARDYDIVITTISTEDKQTLWNRLFDALNDGAAGDKDVDVILYRASADEIGDLARAILAGRVLWGPGDETIATAKQVFEERGGAAGSFRYAQAVIECAEDHIAQAQKEEDPKYKAICYKLAFKDLCDGARVAAVTHMAMAGIIQLPVPHDQTFREMIITLKNQYYYELKYPRDPEVAAREFAIWNNKALAFVAAIRKHTLNQATTNNGL